MNRFIKSKSSGFSLIELMIGVVIMGILVAVALPSYRAWILNAQIRNAAESIQNGLQRARAEALARRNVVSFVLRPAVGNNTTSWVIIEIVNGVANPPIETRLSNEGSTSVQLTPTPAGATTASFDMDGMPVTPPALLGGALLTSVALTSSVLTAAEAQNLVVDINFNGTLKMCDPHILAPDARACN